MGICKTIVALLRWLAAWPMSMLPWKKLPFVCNMPNRIHGSLNTRSRKSTRPGPCALNMSGNKPNGKRNARNGPLACPAIQLEGPRMSLTKSWIKIMNHWKSCRLTPNYMKKLPKWEGIIPSLNVVYSWQVCNVPFPQWMKRIFDTTLHSACPAQVAPSGLCNHQLSKIPCTQPVGVPNEPLPRDTRGRLRQWPTFVLTVCGASWWNI
mmetsp:Transcript_17264/g.42117  ORF Transcript_17264/g.42117 Transcript_17264/m.42117 type:complete len:208 (+) Transcript_17264:1149-1772(+)